ncbi:MAG: alpha/beta fold hydrolase [Pseudonocardia sp.]
MATVSILHPSSGSADETSSVSGFHRAGQGTPLVLLHGANLSWRVWRPVLPFLTGRHDVFVPTMAGHRGGPVLGPESGLGMAAVVDALCDQLDQAGIETVHLAGKTPSLVGPPWSWPAGAGPARSPRSRRPAAGSPVGT